MRWLALLVLMLSSPSSAQQPSQGKVDQLLELLRDPEIQTWLTDRDKGPPPAPEVKSSPLSVWESRTRQRIDGVVAAAPRIPSEVAAAAARIREDALSRGYAPVLPMMVGIALIGILAEHLFSRRRRQDGSLDRFLPVLVFAAVMSVVFFAISWPPLGRIVMLAYLSGFAVYRILSTTIGLAVDEPGMRLRIRLFAGVAIFAVCSSIVGREIEIDPPVQSAISYVWSAVLLALAIEGVWATSARRPPVRAALSLCIFFVWMLWCIELPGLFWIGVYALALPPMLRAITSSIRSTLDASGIRSLRGVLLVRGVRGLVIALAAGWLAVVWHVDTNSLAYQSPRLAAVLFGLLKSIVVLLLADLVWHLARASIEQRIRPPAQVGEDAQAHPASATRLHTLLPIFKNVLGVIVVTVAGLTVLSELGVEIGPLIAGAGIFGVALGFGSQTLVKDVISGVFYMLDDAFRVGEYIQAKSYKGTVEGFSLRSVRLRHHRGPVFTVPFGELGAVENMSRDWSVDKFRISVAYDTDIEKARKLVKKIGADLQEDPEFGPLFIQPLKMKGVEEFGDYGIVLSFGMTLRPGQATTIRRRAYALIRKAFSENGIEFATPSVQVGSDERQAAAAAATATRLQQAKAAGMEG